MVDFQWNPHEPWTIMSVSDESQMEGGGTMQLWRISDLLHRPEEEVLAELEANRCFFRPSAQWSQLVQLQLSLCCEVRCLSAGGGKHRPLLARMYALGAK